ncbi:UNVERIFIED_CONTAM: hypothetical protein HDU68_001970, partial [Siphonaria sp. JEL0065]
QDKQCAIDQSEANFGFLAGLVISFFGGPFGAIPLLLLGFQRITSLRGYYMRGMSLALIVFSILIFGVTFTFPVPFIMGYVIAGILAMIGILVYFASSSTIAAAARGEGQLPQAV